MPSITPGEAAETLARALEKAKPSHIGDFYSELFPDKPAVSPPTAEGLARHVRDGIEPEELVDLWNVVYPEHRNVHYDEDTNRIHYSDTSYEYAD